VTITSKDVVAEYFGPEVLNIPELNKKELEFDV
jgi:hypothetical protein